MTKLTELRELLARATDAPWRPYQCGRNDEDEACGIKSGPFVSDFEDAYQRGVVYDTSRDECHHHMAPSDAALIAALRNAAPALLDVVEAAVAWSARFHDQQELRAMAGSDPLYRRLSPEAETLLAAIAKLDGAW